MDCEVNALSALLGAQRCMLGSPPAPGAAAARPPLAERAANPFGLTVLRRRDARAAFAAEERRWDSAFTPAPAAAAAAPPPPSKVCPPSPAPSAEPRGRLSFCDDSGSRLLERAAPPTASCAAPKRKRVIAKLVLSPAEVEGAPASAARAPARRRAADGRVLPAAPARWPRAATPALPASPLMACPSPGPEARPAVAAAGGLSPLPAGPPALLPTVDNPECGLPSVSAATLAAALADGGAAAFGASGVDVLDCRYAFEFAGGRVRGSRNTPAPADLDAFFERPDVVWTARAVILLCEFSSERAPRAFRYVRGRDREAHLASYPQLAWPQLFVLRGGFRALAAAAPHLVDGALVPMDAPEHAEEARACHRAAQQAWARAQGAPPSPVRQRPRPKFRAPGGGGGGGAAR
jgi:hypothetical protein